MDLDPKGKDGVQRNVLKLREEIAFWWDATKEDRLRWLKRPWDLHAYVNMYVESRRASPYLTGHVDAVLYPLGAIIIIALAI
jgi:hypothetical protein